MAKIGYSEAAETEVTIEMLDDVIARVETLLAGNIDDDNIYEAMKVSSQAIYDVDGYLNGKVMIGDGINTMLTKLSNYLDDYGPMSTVETKISFNITNDSTEVENNVTQQSSAYISGSDNAVLYTSTSTTNRNVYIDKAPDTRGVTFEEFFSIIYYTIGYKWGAGYYPAHFVSEMCNLYDVKYYDIVESNTIEVKTSIDYLNDEYSRYPTLVIGKTSLSQTLAETPVSFQLVVYSQSSGVPVDPPDDFFIKIQYNREILTRLII